MLKRLLLALLLLPGIANAQFTNGQVLTAAQLNSAFSATLPLTGGTLTGPLTVPSLGLTTPLGFASGGTGTTTATGATGALQYLQGSTGSVARSVTSKLQDTINAHDFGALCNGSNDDTSSIQAALNYAGSLVAAGESEASVFVPNGRCLVTTLIMPNSDFINLLGYGPSSQLVAIGGDVITWPAQPSGNLLVSYDTIGNFLIDGTNGSGNEINTQYVSGTNIRDVWLNSIPVGKDGILVQGNGSAYSHDITISGITLNTSTGNAAIEFSGTSSDSKALDLDGNGNFGLVNWILVDPGSAQLQVSDGHISNTSGNVIAVGSVSGTVKFTNIIADNSSSDVVHLTDATGVSFDNSKIMFPASGHSALVVDSSFGNEFSNMEFEGGVAGDVSAISEINGSSQNIYDGFIRGSNFSEPISVTGANSIVRTNLFNTAAVAAGNGINTSVSTGSAYGITTVSLSPTPTVSGSFTTTGGNFTGAAAGFALDTTTGINSGGAIQMVDATHGSYVRILNSGSTIETIGPEGVAVTGSASHSSQEIDESYIYNTPATGTTVTMATGTETAIINPAGTLAALTVTLPACTSGYDGSIARYSSTQAITALTVSATSGTVSSAPATLAAGAGHAMLCRGSNTTWYPLY